MRRDIAGFATAGVLVLAACSPADAEGLEKDTYLSLGDSLAVGFQPDESGGGETPYGYPEVLYRSLYGSDSTLDHESMGCPGEDTTSMLEGSEFCHYDEGSQLEAAEAFMEDNRDSLRLVTLGVGANNFTICVEEDGDAFTIDEECVDEGLDRLHSELPDIVERVRDAAGDDVQIVGMNYYNPFVVASLTEDEPTDEDADAASDDETAGEDEDAPLTGEALAEYGNEVLAELNDEIADAYAANDVDLADVAREFEWDNDEESESDTGLPTNVQMICDYTWMCDTALGPDIHTNDAGGQLIAEVFRGELPR
ncbi:SGNH/GDSL hydrolase family protein [Spiractinospora alimapuensis]|uniref:GDSL-type esterase/lipase family protein n=1 Tax=Spiractinospora alimapuensis TaxID=2820884 RepID=UPI001F37BC1E|nr:GDSL-type esterase/lipase family protein [Spiractinospora alimapuensis]QVQ51397.1 SGNH/GDSL hydrolase family protein [Spiractinospora alimapuensis]